VDSEASILYLGTTTFLQAGWEGLDKRPVSRMITDFFPGIELDEISLAGADPGVYLTLLRRLPADHPVETVVIALDLRSFSVAWQLSDNAARLRKERVLLGPYPALVNRGLMAAWSLKDRTGAERTRLLQKEWRKKQLAGIPGLKYERVEDWDRAMAREGIQDGSGEYDVQLTGIACDYIKSYGFNLSNPEKNTVIRDLDKIHKLAVRRNWNLVIQILPVQVEAIKTLVGEDLVGLVHQNRDVLRKHYTGQPVHIVDNLEAIQPEWLVDTLAPDPYLREGGRKHMAHHIAETLAPLHTSYTSPDGEDYWLPVFAKHDGESRIGWGQEQTLSGEAALSGRFSSKMDKEQPYGITFHCNMDQVAVDYRNRVELSMAVRVVSKIIEPKIIIEQFDGSGKQHWEAHGLPAARQNADNGWETVRLSFPLLKETREIKIYPYNDSSIPVFVDDLSIRFSR
jgi:hypothetical protein